MNQKVLKTLEYYKIIDRLTDCAASEPGKKMCRELTPSSNFNEIVQTQTETADAVTRVRQKGSLSLAGVRDVRDSLKRQLLKHHGASLRQRTFDLCGPRKELWTPSGKYGTS